MPLPTRTDSAKTLPCPAPMLRIGHVHLDPAGQLLRCLNDAARELHREGIPFSPDDLEKHPMQTPGGARVRASDLPLVRAWREGQPHTAVFLLPGTGAQTLQIRWSAAPLLDVEGSVTAVFGTVLVGPPDPDWHALAGLAHDVRTPLQSLQLFAALLDGQTDLPPNVREVLDLMRSSAERASAIARELLEWCRRPAQNSRRSERTVFPLRPFLSSIIDEHAISARGKELTLIGQYDATEGWEICTDQVKFGRLLSNLLTNAIRYTPRGRVEFTAQWRELPPTRGESDPFGGAENARQRRPALVLSVVDTGVGITAEEHDTIFHPFERGRAAEHDSGGSGIGLATVECLVEELGLTLEVYSVFGQGSAFDLVIPPRLLHSPLEIQPTE